MASQEIFTDTSAVFETQTTTLDGVAYLLTFRYNTRESCYYVTIASSDDTIEYVGGLKLVTNFPLLQSYPTPPGELVCQSFSSDDTPPALGELGDGCRCTLYYIEQADVLNAGVDPARNPGFIVPVPNIVAPTW
jgi:hypothetical protein